MNAYTGVRPFACVACHTNEITLVRNLLEHFSQSEKCYIDMYVLTRELNRMNVVHHSQRQFRSTLTKLQNAA